MQLNLQPCELSAELQRAIVDAVQKARRNARADDGTISRTTLIDSAGHVVVSLTVYDDDRVTVYWDQDAIPNA